MRKLTGSWYLKKRWFGYQLMVQVIYQSFCTNSFDPDPLIERYEKATEDDILTLGISVA